MLENKEFHSILGKRIKKLRGQRGLTLTRLAEKAGISKGSLSVLEDGRGNPTISTIWRLADALEVSFGEFARFNDSEGNVGVEDKGIVVRLIERTTSGPLMETYLMKMSANSIREAEPHSPGVVEKVMVLKGEMTTGAVGYPERVGTGESYEFKADCIHIYRSIEEPVTAIISVQYPDESQDVDVYTRYRHIYSAGEKEDLIAFINRHIMEVVNGVTAYRLIFRIQPGASDIASDIKKELAEIKSNRFSFPIYLFLREKNDLIEVCILPRFNSGLAVDSKFFRNFYLHDLEKNNPWHPGYAGQVTEIAEMISSHYQKVPERIVYAGPDNLFQMMLEFFPLASAVSAGDAPLSCVDEYFSGPEYDGSKQVIISVGVSHYLNAAFFFQKARDLLTDDGLLVVGDDFISPFLCEEERNSLILRHYLVYMLDVIANVSGEIVSGLTKAEVSLIEVMEKELPVMYFEASAGMAEAASIRAKRLLKYVNSIVFTDNPDDRQVNFYRFIVGELESLVAGLQYDSKQMTYADNFIFLAEYAGLKLEDHRRVYATVGGSKMDGGIHVFAFSKQI